jgi:two-component system response regulator YesN
MIKRGEAGGMSKLYAFLSSMSFKRKLFAYSLLISIVPVLLVGSASYYILTKSMQEEVDQKHQLMLKQIEYQLNQFISGLNISSIALASNVTLGKSVESGPRLENLNQTFQVIETIRKQKSFSTIKFEVSLIYKKFNHIYSTHHQTSSFTDSKFHEIMNYTQPKYNSSFIIAPYSFMGQDELLLFRPVPLHSYYSDGIVVIHVGINELTKLIDKLTLDHHNHIFIVDNQGKVIISGNKEEIGTKLTSSTSLYQFWKNPKSFHGSFTLDGVDYSLSAQKSSINNWTYIVMTPSKELTKKLDDIKRMTLYIISVIILLWMIISFIGSKRLYFPIEKLLKLPSEFRTGNPNSDELKELDSFVYHIININKRLKSQLDEQLPYYKESIFHQLLGGELSDSEVLSKTKQLNLPLTGSWFTICIVSVDENEHFIEKYREKDRSLIHYALRKIVEEICEDKIPCITFTPQAGQVVVIIGTDKKSQTADEKIRGLANDFRHHIHTYLRFNVSVSISQTRRDYSSIHTSYQEALALLSYRLLMGHNVTIVEKEVEPSIKQSSRELIQLQKNIAFSVVQGDLKNATVRLHQMIQIVPKYVHSSETVFGLFSYLIGELDHQIYEMGYELNEFVDIDLYKSLYQQTSLSDVNDWLSMTVFPIIKEKLEELKITKQQRIIQQVILYLKENFETDLSLQQIADQFKISASYLSRTFKEENNVNFSDYLIELRLTKAKDWLENTDMPIKEIAERLRYSTVQNFSRVFKQWMNIPPGEYRKKYIDNEST